MNGHKEVKYFFNSGLGFQYTRTYFLNVQDIQVQLYFLICY